MRDVYLDANCNKGGPYGGVGGQNRDIIVGNPYKEDCIVRFVTGGVGDRGLGLPRTYSTIKLKVGMVC